MVPNEYGLVVEVVGPRLALVGDEEETRANSFWAVNDGCHEARKKDRRWGLLVKTGGAQVEQRAADIWLYNLGNGTAQVVDIVGNAEGAAPPEGGPRTAPVASWGEADIRGMDEWVEPYPRSDGGTSGGDGSGEIGDLVERVETLETLVTQQGEEIVTLNTQVATLTEQVGVLDARLKTLEDARALGFHAHGPVNLPIVLESLTSLRCIGDIDVAVKPGMAVPPDASSGSVSLASLVILKRLLDRRDDETQP